MKKILKLSLITAAVLVSGAQAYSNSSLTKSQLIEKINKLEKELREFKQDAQEQLDDLNDRVDENELQTALNKIKWNGEFITRVGSFYGRTNGVDYSNVNKWDMQLRLGMESHINEKTKFTGRLVMTKAWANSTPMMQENLDSVQGRAYGTTSLFVERAYVDYKITPKIIATVGRQPSSDGPGLSLKYDTPRKSTYPALLFNGQADGVVLTYKASKTFTTRLAYGKGYQWDDRMYGFNAYNPGIKDTNVYGFFMEGKIKSSALGRNLWVFSLVRTTNLITNPFDPNPATNKSLGGYNHVGLYFENYHPFGSKIDYFISLAYAKPDSNGNTGMYDFNGDGVAETPVKLLKDEGYAYDIGIRYDVQNNFKIGYELNYGSKYWFSFSANLTDPINKLATRGNVNDFYIIYNMDLFQLIRLGYTYVNYNYSGSGMYFAPNDGEPSKVNDYYRLFYATYDVRF